MPKLLVFGQHFLGKRWTERNPRKKATEKRKKLPQKTQLNQTKVALLPACLNGFEKPGVFEGKARSIMMLERVGLNRDKNGELLRSEIR